MEADIKELYHSGTEASMQDIIVVGYGDVLAIVPVMHDSVYLAILAVRYGGV
jgi:hypothetical protein